VLSSGQYINEVILNKPVAEDSYLRALPVVRYLTEHHKIAFRKPVTFFVGENGTGKSTLIEAIAVAFGFNAEGGTRNYAFSTRESHTDLWKYVTLSKSKYAEDGFFLRAESFYNAASYLEVLNEIPANAPPLLDYYGGMSLHERSHGESFLALVQNRFSGHGVYILDEPEAALSPTHILTLMACMHALVKQDSQFIIATHSPMLMAYPDAEVWEFSEAGITPVHYADTEHYQVTKRFLNDPDAMLRRLLEE
jgi:predicted ATPase